MLKHLSPCQKSGNCCRGQGYVYLTRQDIKAAAKLLGISELDFKTGFTCIYRRYRILKSNFSRTEEEKCVFLINSLCKIENAKPLQCKKWPLWPDLYESESIFNESRATCSMLKDLNYKDFRLIYEDSLKTL